MYKSISYNSLSNPDAVCPPPEDCQTGDTWRSANGDYEFRDGWWFRIDTGNAYNLERTLLDKQPWSSPTPEELLARAAQRETDSASG